MNVSKQILRHQPLPDCLGKLFNLASRVVFVHFPSERDFFIFAGHEKTSNNLNFWSLLSVIDLASLPPSQRLLLLQTENGTPSGAQTFRISNKGGHKLNSRVVEGPIQRLFSTQLPRVRSTVTKNVLLYLENQEF